MFNSVIFDISTQFNYINIVKRWVMVFLLGSLMILFSQNVLAETENCMFGSRANCKCKGNRFGEGSFFPRNCECSINLNDGGTEKDIYFRIINPPRASFIGSTPAKVACWAYNAYQEAFNLGFPIKYGRSSAQEIIIQYVYKPEEIDPECKKATAVTDFENRTIKILGDAQWNVRDGWDKYLIAHEMFHLAQGNSKLPKKKNLYLEKGDTYGGQAAWLIDGTAVWFEDELYDDEDPYVVEGFANKLKPIYEALSVGLDALYQCKSKCCDDPVDQQQEKLVNPYKRFAFFKLILGRCPSIRLSLEKIFNVSNLNADPTGIKNLEFIMAKTEATEDCQDLDWKCFGEKITNCVTQCSKDFVICIEPCEGDINCVNKCDEIYIKCLDKCNESTMCPPSPDDPSHYRSSFDKFNQEYHLFPDYNLLRTAMQVYQVATVIKNDMSILDSNEKKDGGYFVGYNNPEFNGLLNIKGDISQIGFGTLSNKYSGNMPPYSAKTIVVNSIAGDIRKSIRKPYLSVKLEYPGITEPDHILWDENVSVNITDVNHKESMWGDNDLIIPNLDKNRFWWAYDKCLTDNQPPVKTAARYMTIVNTNDKNKLSAEVFAGIAPKSYFSMSIGGNEKISCISSYEGGSEYLLNPANPNYFDAINLHTIINIGNDESRVADFQLGFMNPVNLNNGPYIVSSAGGFYVHKKGNQEIESIYLSQCPGTYGTLNIQSVQPYSLPKLGCESGKLVTGTFSFDGCRSGSTTAIRVAGNFSAVAPSNCRLDQ